MNFQAVRSGAVDRVAYDPDTQELHIVFKGGAHYKYTKVPPKKFEELMKAESIGKHVATHIRDHHEFEKVTTPHGH